jgi:hypothetical protein
MLTTGHTWNSVFLSLVIPDFFFKFLLLKGLLYDTFLLYVEKS